MRGVARILLIRTVLLLKVHVTVAWLVWRWTEIRCWWVSHLLLIGWSKIPSATTLLGVTTSTGAGSYGGATDIAVLRLR